jgi:hypothetical protein
MQGRGGQILIALCMIVIMSTERQIFAADSQWWKPYADDSNTLGLWHFDDVTSITAISFADDDSANPSRNNNGTRPAYSSSPVTSTAGLGLGVGLFGKALQGGGSSWNHVIADDNTDMEPASGGSMTIEAWICPVASDLSGAKGIVNKGGVTMFNFYLANGHLRGEFNTSSYHYILGNTLLQAGRWYHVAMAYETKYDGSHERARLYVNGQIDVEGTYPTVSGNLGNNSSPLAIGVIDNAGNTYSNFVGAIDEVRYSRIARTYSTYQGPAASCGSLGFWVSDINNDCVVDFKDFAVIAEQWLGCSILGCQ